MENISEKKGFYAYRTTLRAMSDGVSLFTKNAAMLLKATWPLLLITSLLGGWFAVGVTKICVDLLVGTLLEWSDLGLWMALPGLLTLCFMVLFFALVYTLLSQYVENGFIPTQKRKKFQLCPKITKLPRLLLGGCWCIFVSVLYVLLAYVLYTVSVWSLIATIPLYIVLMFWLANQLVGYVLIADTLVGSIRHSLGITLKGLGSFIAVSLMLALVLGAIGVVCMIPAISTETIYMKAQFSLAEGDNGDLPSYFTPVYFLACTLSTFLTLLLNAVQTSCWSLVYGAVDTRIKLKRAEKKN